MQSSMERIVLLPALPKAWNSGSIEGLRIKGCGEVKITWEDGMLKECLIRAEKGMTSHIKYREFVVNVTWEPGEIKRFIWDGSKLVERG